MNRAGHPVIPAEAGIRARTLRHGDRPAGPARCTFAAMGRPNVLLVMADQLAPHFTGTYGHPSWLGRLVGALGEVGELDRTVVIATSDHGDMLGDRGTWFKMCFYERSARVPLVVAGPDVVHRTVGNACSLLDLFPTLLDIAGDGTEPAAPLVGRSLWPSATGGEDPVDETIGEYTAEMTSHPIHSTARLSRRRGSETVSGCAVRRGGSCPRRSWATRR